jgi:hypothetical protein
VAATFVRVESALEASKALLTAADAYNTEAESYLVGYLLIVVHSEFEQWIAGTLRARVAVANDPHLTAWGEHSIARLAKKISVSDLSGVLGKFDEGCKQSFQGAVLNTVHHLAYDNLESNRQLVAHASGTGLTLADVEAAFRSATQVLDRFETAVFAGRPAISP